MKISHLTSTRFILLSSDRGRAKLLLQHKSVHTHCSTVNISLQTQCNMTRPAASGEAHSRPQTHAEVPYQPPHSQPNASAPAAEIPIQIQIPGQLDSHGEPLNPLMQLNLPLQQLIAQALSGEGSTAPSGANLSPNAAHSYSVQSGQLPPQRMSYIDPTTGQPVSVAMTQSSQVSVSMSVNGQPMQPMQSNQMIQPPAYAQAVDPQLQLMMMQQQQQQQQQQPTQYYSEPGTQPPYVVNTSYTVPPGGTVQQHSNAVQLVSAQPNQLVTQSILTPDEAKKKGIDVQRDIVGGGKVGDTSFDVTEKGVETYDASLTSIPTVLDFLTAHNCRPGLQVHVRGTHIEHYTTRDSKGHVHHHTRTVTDFSYSIDLSQYVAAAGDIEQPIEFIDKYLNSKSAMRRLTMIKSLNWNSEALTASITAQIRALGYGHTISVSYPMKFNKIKIYSSDRMSRCCNHTCSKVVFWLTCTCCFYYCFMSCMTDKVEIKSVFPLTKKAEEIFEVIKPQVHR